MTKATPCCVPIFHPHPSWDMETRRDSWSKEMKRAFPFCVMSSECSDGDDNPTNRRTRKGAAIFCQHELARVGARRDNGMEDSTPVEVWKEPLPRTGFLAGARSQHTSLHVGPIGIDHHLSSLRFNAMEGTFHKCWNAPDSSHTK